MAVNDNLVGAIRQLEAPSEEIDPSAASIDSQTVKTSEIRVVVGTMGLNQYGPIVNAEDAKPLYGYMRRLISNAVLKGTAKEQADRGHGYVIPNKGSRKNADGKFLQDAVWRYLYNSLVDAVGKPAAPEAGATMD